MKPIIAATTITIAGVFALALITERIYFEEHVDSIQWIEFTKKKRDKYVESGKTVLLFANPMYHVGSELAEQTFEHPELKELNREGQFIAMKLEYNDWEGDEIRGLFRIHGNTKEPFGYLYSPQHDPVPIDVFSPDDVVRKLSSVSP
jgi:hypothetical protein